MVYSSNDDGTIVGGENSWGWGGVEPGCSTEFSTVTTGVITDRRSEKRGVV